MTDPSLRFDVAHLRCQEFSWLSVGRQAASTVRLTMRRVAAAGMVDGIPVDQTDAALEKLLFTGSGKKTGHRRCADPDWAELAKVPAA